MPTLTEWIRSEARAGKAIGVSDTEAYWQAFEEARAKWDAWAAKKIRAAFRAELRDVLAADGAAGVTPERWQELLSALYRKVGAAFARRFDASRGPKAAGFFQRKEDIADLWFAAIEDYIAAHVGEKVLQIIQTTQELIKEAIRRGIEEGEGVYEISQRIDRLYLEQIIPNRSEVIARTEVMAASNAGTQAAARALGIDLVKTWVATPDSRTRDAHRAADGQQRPLDQPYVVDGERLMFPGDGSLGASANNLIQCRCVEVYGTV